VKDGVTLALGSSFMKKKLIEVALALELINKASAREKFPSERHRSAVTIAYFC
jgi:adenine-specific DNA methylase